MLKLTNTKTRFTQFTRLVSALSLLSVSLQIMAQEHEEFMLPDNENGQPISFVSCPIAQDTNSVPCWFGTNQGTRYYLGITQDIGDAFHPPQLKHKVLVEGRVLAGVSLCGAQVIHPVVISVLPELSEECNTLLPIITGIEPPPHERGPGPSDRGLEPRAPQVTPPAPTPPYQSRKFSYQFSFDSPYMVGRQTGVIGQAITYANQINAGSIEITINRGATKLSDGSQFVETANVIDERSSRLRYIFNEAGFGDEKLVIHAQYTAAEGTGENDYLSRTVEIIVHPAAM